MAWGIGLFCGKKYAVAQIIKAQRQKIHAEHTMNFDDTKNKFSQVVKISNALSSIINLGEIL
jgi:hypothetical protein